MMKRLFSAVIVLTLLIGLIPCNALAANQVDRVEIIQLEDGGYVEIYTETSPARAANTVTGSRTYTYYDTNNVKSWAAKLTATFAYSGGWYTCTTANCNVTIYDNQWYVISNSTVRSSNNAVTNLTMGLRTAGVTISRPQYTIKLTCDNNGNLS